MTHATAPRLAFVTVLALAALGCDPAPPDGCSLPESLVGPNPSVIPVGEVEGFEPTNVGVEGGFVQIAQDVPSFAGFYVDGGHLVVQVADPAEAVAAVEAVRASARDVRREIRTKVVQYSYMELARWEHAAVVNLAHLGLTQGVVISNGVDEVENVVRIGANQGTCTTHISQLLNEAGIPADALVVEEDYPAVPSYR